MAGRLAVVLPQMCSIVVTPQSCMTLCSCLTKGCTNSSNISGEIMSPVAVGSAIDSESRSSACPFSSSIL